MVGVHESGEKFGVFIRVEEKKLKQKGRGGKKERSRGGSGRLGSHQWILWMRKSRLYFKHSAVC